MDGHVFLPRMKTFPSCRRYEIAGLVAQTLQRVVPLVWGQSHTLKPVLLNSIPAERILSRINSREIWSHLDVIHRADSGFRKLASRAIGRPNAAALPAAWRRHPAIQAGV